MNRARRLGLVGGLAAVALAATPFACLWALQARDAEPPPANVLLDIAIWMAVFGTPAMLAAWLLWRAWWRRAGGRLSALDAPGWLLAAAAATLPADRRRWGPAMAAELAQVQGRRARWRFAAGCARTAVFPPGGSRAAVGATGALAAGAIAAAAVLTGAAYPRGECSRWSSWGCWGGWRPWRWRGRAGSAGPGRARRWPG